MTAFPHRIFGKRFRNVPGSILADPASGQGSQNVHLIEGIIEARVGTLLKKGKRHGSDCRGHRLVGILRDSLIPNRIYRVREGVITGANAVGLYLRVGYHPFGFHSHGALVISVVSFGGELRMRGR